MPARRSFAVLTLALVAGLTPLQGAAKEGVAGAFLAAKIAAANADFRAADLWFQRGLALEPSNVAILEGAMIAALSLGEIDRAADLARQLTKLEAGLAPGDQRATLPILAAAAKAKDYAALLATQKLGDEAGSMQDDLLAGWAHIGLGEMNDGIARFDKVAAIDGLTAFGLYHKSIALALAGDFDGAAQALGAPEADMLRNTRRGTVLYAEILSQTGKAAEAAALLEKAFPLGGDPRIVTMIAALKAGQALPISGFQDASSGLAETFFSVASALDDGNDPTYTLMQARIASVLRPDDTEALMLTASVLEQVKQFDLAAETYAQVPADHPDFAAAEIGRADAVYAAGRKDDSLKIMQDLAAALPEHFEVQVALGHALRRAEQYTPAIAAYDAAVALQPENSAQNWPLLYSRAIALDSLGAYDRAETDFRAALAISPNQPNVLNYLGYSLVDRGQKLEEALGMIKRAVALDPQSGYIVDSLAWAYFRLGRYGEALAPMESAAQLEPIDPIVTDHLGDVYWANGRAREAAFQWRRALSFSPTEKDAARIRLKLELGLDEVRVREGAPPIAGQGEGGL